MDNASRYFCRVAFPFSLSHFHKAKTVKGGTVIALILLAENIKYLSVNKSSDEIMEAVLLFRFKSKLMLIEVN